MAKEIVLTILAFVIGLYLGAVLMCTAIHNNQPNTDVQKQDSCGSCWAVWKQ